MKSCYLPRLKWMVAKWARNYLNLHWCWCCCCRFCCRFCCCCCYYSSYCSVSLNGSRNRADTCADRSDAVGAVYRLEKGKTKKCLEQTKLHVRAAAMPLSWLSHEKNPITSTQTHKHLYTPQYASTQCWGFVRACARVRMCVFVCVCCVCFFVRACLCACV